MGDALSGCCCGVVGYYDFWTTPRTPWLFRPEGVGTGTDMDVQHYFHPPYNILTSGDTYIDPLDLISYGVNFYRMSPYSGRSYEQVESNGLTLDSEILNWSESDTGEPTSVDRQWMTFYSVSIPYSKTIYYTYHIYKKAENYWLTSGASTTQVALGHTTAHVLAKHTRAGETLESDSTTTAVEYTTILNYSFSHPAPAAASFEDSIPVGGGSSMPSHTAIGMFAGKHQPEYTGADLNAVLDFPCPYAFRIDHGVVGTYPRLVSPAAVNSYYLPEPRAATTPGSGFYLMESSDNGDGTYSSEKINLSTTGNVFYSLENTYKNYLITCPDSHSNGEKGAGVRWTVDFSGAGSNITSFSDLGDIELFKGEALEPPDPIDASQNLENINLIKVGTPTILDTSETLETVTSGGDTNRRIIYSTPIHYSEGVDGDGYVLLSMSAQNVATTSTTNDRAALAGEDSNNFGTTSYGHASLSLTDIQKMKVKVFTSTTTTSIDMFGDASWRTREVCMVPDGSGDYISADIFLDGTLHAKTTKVVSQGNMYQDIEGSLESAANGYSDTESSSDSQKSILVIWTSETTTLSISSGTVQSSTTTAVSGGSQHVIVTYGTAGSYSYTYNLTSSSDFLLSKTRIPWDDSAPHPDDIENLSPVFTNTFSEHSNENLVYRTQIFEGGTTQPKYESHESAFGSVSETTHDETRYDQAQTFCGKTTTGLTTTDSRTQIYALQIEIPRDTQTASTDYQQQPHLYGQRIRRVQQDGTEVWTLLTDGITDRLMVADNFIYTQAATSSYDPYWDGVSLNDKNEVAINCTTGYPRSLTKELSGNSTQDSFTALDEQLSRVGHVVLSDEISTKR